jgi:hypothetical protein
MKKKIRKLAKKAGFIFWKDEPWCQEEYIDWSSNYDKELVKFYKLVKKELKKK